MNILSLPRRVRSVIGVRCQGLLLRLEHGRSSISSFRGVEKIAILDVR